MGEFKKVISSVFLAAIAFNANGGITSKAETSEPVVNDDIKVFIDQQDTFKGNSDTPEGRMVFIDVTAQIRTQMKVVSAAGKGLGYTYSAELLNHSLQNKPTNKSYSNTSGFAKLIKGSDEHKKILSDVKGSLKKETKNTYSLSNKSTVFTSNTDLRLSLQTVAYKVSATREKPGKPWNITITYTDKYDFHTVGWKSYGKLSGNALVALNNYGSTAQSLGAIVPFDVTISTSETY